MIYFDGKYYPAMKTGETFIVKTEEIADNYKEVDVIAEDSKGTLHRSRAIKP
jgi:hypothetical protein